MSKVWFSVDSLSYQRGKTWVLAERGEYVGCSGGRCGKGMDKVQAEDGPEGQGGLRSVGWRRPCFGERSVHSGGSDGGGVLMGNQRKISSVLTSCLWDHGWAYSSGKDKEDVVNLELGMHLQHYAAAVLCDLLVSGIIKEAFVCIVPLSALVRRWYSLLGTTLKPLSLFLLNYRSNTFSVQKVGIMLKLRKGNLPIILPPTIISSFIYILLVFFFYKYILTIYRTGVVL